MTTIANPPIWQQNRQYSARLDRTILDLIFTEGVVDPDLDNFEVTETSPQSLSVAIDVGRAVIDGDDEVRQGKYLVVNDAVLNVPITAAPLAPNDRIDLIVLRVNDPVAGSARTPPNVCEVVAIPGTPDPSPVAPAVPDTAIPLAEVYVEAGATFIATADITDRRTGASTAQKRVIVRKTANYTLALGDEGKVINMDSTSSLTLTLPTAVAQPFPIGTQIDIVRSNTGVVTIAGASGVTLSSVAGKDKLAAQFSAGTVLKINTNEWLLVGDIAS